MIFNIRSNCTMPLDLLTNWNGKKWDARASSNFSCFLSCLLSFCLNIFSVSFFNILLKFNDNTVVLVRLKLISVLI